MIEKGLCQCGCGGKTNISRYNDSRYGQVKGEPFSYLRGHNPCGRKPKPIQYVVDEKTGCWIWQLVKSKEGYGYKRVGVRKMLAHRYMYEKMVSPIPPGAQLDHLCRTPACVNPDHLEPVTQRENIRRGLTPKLTASMVSNIKTLLSSGASGNSIARAYRICPKTVYQIKSGITWTDIRC